MPKPTQTPRWANVGGSIVEPLEGKKDIGYVNAELPTHSEMNWLFNLIYQWAVWLDGLQAEALTWTNVNTFQKGVVVTQSTLNGVGLTVTGNGGGDGVFGTGGSTGGAGVHGLGGAFGASGILGVGNGNGDGVTGNGGSTNGSVGVRGTSGATNGSGGYFEGSGTGEGLKGVSFGTGVGVVGIGGTNQSGITGAGGGSGAGMVGTGGATAGSTGVIGTSAATNGNGGQFSGTGTGVGVTAIAASAGGKAIQLNEGNLAFGSFNTEPAYADAILDRVTQINVEKAWALFQCNGTTGNLVQDGFNVTSVVQSIAGGNNGELTFTIAQDMASGTYGLVGVCESNPTYGLTFAAKGAGSFTARPTFLQDGTFPTATVTNGFIFTIRVVGRQ